MARTTDQIMRELDAFFEPSRKVIRQQRKQIQPFVDSQLAGLSTEKENTFRDIVTQANRRGTVFGGMPIAEQSRYLGERYLPARAGIRQAGIDLRGQLADRLASLEKERGLAAQSIYQKELDRDAARAAANSQRRSYEQYLKQQEAKLDALFNPPAEGGNVEGQQNFTTAELLAEAKSQAQQRVVDLTKNLSGQDRATVFNSLVKNWQDGLFNDRSKGDQILASQTIQQMAEAWGLFDPITGNNAGAAQPDYKITGSFTKGGSNAPIKFRLGG